MSLSKTEVINRAATDYLGILTLGQSLQSQDFTRIKQAYNEVYAYLKTKNLVTWVSSGDVPTNLVPHVVAMVANNCYNVYGVSKDRFARIKADYIIAEPKIRELVLPEFVSQVEPKNF